MASTGDGLGRVFNVVHSASGVDIPLTAGTAVSFVSFLADGTHTLVFTQTDSRGVESEADLNIFDVGTTDAPHGKSRVYAGPAVGGTWTDVTTSEAADNEADGGDATNDTYVVTVRAEQLSDGYDRVQCTSATATTVIAIVHDLTVQRKPTNLKSSLTA